MEENKHIDYLNLKNINAPYQTEIEKAIHEVVESGWYLLGEKNRKFEEEYARYIGTQYCVTCGNGLDALKLILQAEIELGRISLGDEVLVAANTYIATILAITSVGLVPILIEPNIETLQINPTLIEQHISPKTKALLTVHLYGKCSITMQMKDICKRHSLLLFEDNAQAHGCTWMGKRTGSLGDAGAHSFYPGKNLGALGDAGAITTDDKQLAQAIRALANYGSCKKYIFQYQGRNSRMDELQAAILSVKLKHLDEDNHKRQLLAQHYLSCLTDVEGTFYVPRHMYQPKEENVVHIFPILSKHRDELQAHLAQHGIHTMIHYPIPPHKQHCYKEWRYMSLPITERIHREELSLPCNPTMTTKDVERIAQIITSYHSSASNVHRTLADDQD